jgi:hypothetical protein
MKHYKDNQNKLYGFAADGSQDHLKPKGLIEISPKEAESIGIANYKETIPTGFGVTDYYRNRLHSYPDMGEFMDAWVKNDQIALEEYRQKCLAVKAKYPKPEGF